jgi:multicomponent Na+:H+ antiporter subunit E
MRIVYLLSYIGYILRNLGKGSVTLAVSVFSPRLRTKPAIVEYPLRCQSDLEVAVFTSSISITPGTLVLGLAGAEGNTPATVYVHSLFSGQREPVLDGLREMEDRLLRATRGRERS